MNWITFLNNYLSYMPWLFCGVGILLVLSLVINLCSNPYAKLNEQTKKAISTMKKYSKRSTTFKNSDANECVPIAYLPYWQSYKLTQETLPSQLLVFKPCKQKKYLLVLSGIGVLICLTFLVHQIVKHKYGFGFYVPILLVLGYAFLLSVANLNLLKKQLRAKKLFGDLVRLLDLYFGKGFYSKNANKLVGQNEELASKGALNAEQTAQPIDKDDGELLGKKIRFLTNKGVGENVAKQLATLLSDNQDQPRSVKTQKELNKVLNDVLQMISKKQNLA